jgi:hypothetical protein
MDFLNLDIGGSFGIGSITDNVGDLYYDSGLHQAWSPFANSITNLFEGVTTGTANVFRGLGDFVSGDNFTLLIIIAGCAVVTYGVVSVYNGKSS